MRAVHLLGLGLVIGATVMGVMLAIMAFRWQSEVFPQQGPAVAAASPGVAAAPLTGDPAKGKTAFDAKCAGCHTIGGGKRTGPDLKSVTTQRPHDWLIDFITAPDRVIASGDRTAAALLKEYGVPMPNLGVSKGEAEDILAHIAVQSGGGAPAGPPGTAAPMATPAPAGAPAAATAPGASPPPGIPTREPGTPLPMIVTPPATTPTAIGTAPARGAQATAAPAAAAPAGPEVAQGKTLFTQKCASCHSIGGGRLAGPDLKGIATQRPHDWLVNFIVAPDKVIASGDPTAAALVKEYGMPMPNLGVSNADAQAILAYIAAESGGGAAAAPAAQAAPVLPPGNPQSGELLFTGEKRLANGGPACLGCHNAAGVAALGGGNWGLDLTHSQTKTGTAGLVSIMKSPPFPGMTEAFGPHPLTDSEIADLAAFFVEEDKRQEEVSPGILFPLIGLGVFLVFLGLMQFNQRGRSQGVRRRLVGGRGR